MYCGKCGQRLDNESLFCPGCGARVSEMIAPTPNHAARKTRFCWAAIPALIMAIFCFLNAFAFWNRGTPYVQFVLSVGAITYLFLSIVLLFRQTGKLLLVPCFAGILLHGGTAVYSVLTDSSFDQIMINTITLLIWIILTVYVSIFVIGSQKTDTFRITAAQRWWIPVVLAGLCFIGILMFIFHRDIVNSAGMGLSAINAIFYSVDELVEFSIFALFCRWIKDPYKPSNH